MGVYYTNPVDTGEARRLATENRPSRAQDLAYGSQAESIRIHKARGMSDKRLIEIYGANAVAYAFQSEPQAVNQPEPPQTARIRQRPSAVTPRVLRSSLR